MKTSSSLTAKRQPLFTAATILRSIAFVVGETDCPPDVDGWVASLGCKKYHLCHGGSRSTPDYDCREGFLFDVTTTNCVDASSVNCAKTIEVTQQHEESITTETESANDGTPIFYFVDIPHSTCYSSEQMAKPSWAQEIFPTKEKCCLVNFPWMPIEHCTGVEFKEADFWTLAPTIASTPAPIVPTLAPIAIPTPTMSPIILTKDDPRYYFMCGVDWLDASTRCYRRCISGEDTDCGPGETCYSQTNCQGGIISSPPTLRPTRRTRKPSTESVSASQTIFPDVDSADILSPTIPIESSIELSGSMQSPALTGSSRPRPVALAQPVQSAVSITSSTSAPSVIISTLSPTDSSVVSTLSPTDPAELSTLSPTFRPSEYIASHSPSAEQHTMPPNNVIVNMIANPVTMSLSSATENPEEASMFNQAYGYGNVVPPIDGAFETPDSQDSRPLPSLYNDVYGYGQTSYRDENIQVPTTTSVESFSSSYTTSITELIIPVSADATVSPLRADLNFGYNSKLALDGGYDSEQFDILLKFDLSLIDQSDVVKSATLRFYSIDNCPSGALFYSTTALNSKWTTSSVTWNTAPQVDNLLGSLDNFSSGWQSVDITTAFSTAASSSRLFITIRVDSTSDGRCFFASMEDPSGNAPSIVFQLEQKSQHEIHGMSESFHQTPVQMQSMPIAGGEFVMIRASSDATIDAIREERMGLMPSLFVSLDTVRREILDSLICFDLSEMHQQRLKPTSAVLILFPEQQCDSAGIIAATGMDGIWPESEVTWNHATDSVLEVGVFDGVEAGQWYGFNVIKVIQWAYSSGRSSMTLRLSSDGGKCKYSSIQSGRAPKLIVSF